MNLLQNVLEADTVLLNARANDWKEAIRLGCDILEEKKIVTAEYFSGIIESTLEYGPYYVFMPHFAMPHARPECGALKTGFCLITLEQAVEFGEPENDPVDILVVLAAKSKEDLNQKAIVQVMEFLEDSELIEKIREASTISSLIDLANKEDINSQ